MKLRFGQWGTVLTVLAFSAWAAADQIDTSEHKQRLDELRRSMQELRRSSLESLNDSADQCRTRALERAVDRIASMTLSRRKATTLPAAAPPPKPEPATRPSETPSSEQAVTEKKEAKPAPVEIGFPKTVENPLALADSLYLDSKPEKALPFYKQALAEIEEENESGRAWILFQIGNCSRKKDVQEALQAYKQLIDTYPKSLWADLADGQYKLTAWGESSDIQSLASEETGGP